MRINKNSKKLLLLLSNDSINYFLNKGIQWDITWEEITVRYSRLVDMKIVQEDLLKSDAATFVTLTIDDQLRGCIGKLEAVQPLYKDIVENSYSAAFKDPRFPPLSQNEFDNLDIEISILTEPKKLNYESPEELKIYLEEHKPGVVLRYGNRHSTFLPQVWEKVSSVEEFLEHLCLKAHLSSDAWKDAKVEIEIYEVIKF